MKSVTPDFFRLAFPSSTKINDPLQLSIIGTLAAFRGQPIRMKTEERFFESVDELIWHILKNNSSLPIPPVVPKRLTILREYFELEDLYSPNIRYDSNKMFRQIFKNQDYSKIQFTEFLSSVESPEIASLVLYLYGPDPLEMLCRRILGLADNAKF